MASLISKVICESESLGSSAQRFRKAQLADATWSLPTWWLLWNPYKYEYVCDLEVLNPIPSIKCCLGTLDFIQSLSNWMSGIRDFVGLLRHKLQGGPAQTICVCSILYRALMQWIFRHYGFNCICWYIFSLPLSCLRMEDQSTRVWLTSNARCSSFVWALVARNASPCKTGPGQTQGK